MTVQQVFDLVFKHNRSLGSVVIGVLALFAILAIIGIWQLDFYTSITPVIILIGVGVLVIVINVILKERLPKLVVSWFLLVIVMVYMTAVATAVVARPAFLPPSHCLVRFWQPCEIVEAELFSKHVAAVPVTDPAPPVQPVAPADVPTPSDPQSIADAQCSGVDLSEPVGSAPWTAKWCGSGGATRTTQQQAFFDPTPSCRAYAQKPYAGLSQNQLFQEAVRLAKAGEFDAAFERIDACQCHNPVSQGTIQEGRLRMLCWLRKQT